VGKKNPSSLDYETLLHELSLKNWRRSILDADFPRAIQNAGQLAQSRDRFWRWQGCLDLAVAHLCQGRSESSREDLEAAKDCFRDIPGLRAPAFEIEAHIWLETGKPHGAIECARRAGIETPLLSYLSGLAHARLEDRASADSDALALSRQSGLGAVLSLHVAAENHPETAVEALEDAVGRLRRDERDPSSAGILVRFALGSVLFARGELERALSELEEVLEEKESLLYWPIPCVRALFLRAKLRGRLGDESGSRADAGKFLSYWGDGDLDRERLEEARQLVKA
jgi:tetratricopeptide (TPR) repeat protein